MAFVRFFYTRIFPAPNPAPVVRLHGVAQSAKASCDEEAEEWPDVTGMMIVLLVTLGLFVVPVGATLMQGPRLLAGLFGG